MCEKCSASSNGNSELVPDRREFLKAMLVMAAVASVTDSLDPMPARADGAYPSIGAALNSMHVERIARLTPLGYQSKQAPSDTTIKWVQVDLGSPRAIDQIKLMPVLDFGFDAQHFPKRFYLQVSSDSSCQSAAMVADYQKADYPSPEDRVAIFDAHGVHGRFVRLTATVLTGKYLALSKLEVWSGGKDVAQGCKVTDIDSMEIFQASAGGDLAAAGLARGSAADQSGYEALRKLHPEMPAYTGIFNEPGTVLPLTRKPRPQGEGVITDNPVNVIPANRWKPVTAAVRPPMRGVAMGDGPFKTVMENNIQYLLNSFSVAHLLFPFRQRAGKPNPPGLPPQVPFWDTDLPGANAGRFLMGAGNALRWIDHPELRRRLNEVVAGIAECQEPGGYAMGYPEDTIFYSERAAYTRSWVTHGLVEAGYAGNGTAFKILRSFYDWFNKCPYLPELLRRAGQGVQGMVANTRTYFTPIGKPEDIQVIQRYFQENYWLEGLAKRDPASVWMYPYDHPHCYLLTSITPYLDQYRATGERKYLDAVLGGWELYHTNWQHIGGAISICEVWRYPPKSAFLHLQNGENCGSSFWISLNHGLHQLFPDEEKYTNEIEKSIYNVLIANQDETLGIRYHTNLDGKKELGYAENTCCEGQGTRQLGSLPEYIYSIADDGLFVNLFAPSTITWRQGGQSVRVSMETEFPFQSAVRLHVAAPQPVKANIRIRIPTWAAGDMAISVNGAMVAGGKPGTYQALERTWTDGDTISFTLPVDFRLSLYTGMDQLSHGLRYALEYGPILMALVSSSLADGMGKPAPPATTQARAAARNIQWGDQAKRGAVMWPVNLPVTAEDLTRRLEPVPGHPLHFVIEGVPEYQYVPYWKINDDLFTCFPVLQTPASYPHQAVEMADFALASKGATVRSDSELSSEPGCTGKIIDGIIATPGNFATNRWQSADTPHPHWVEVKLPRPEDLGRVVINFADPLSHPTSFEGIVVVNGEDRVVFDVTDYKGWRRYQSDIPHVITDTFRLVIRDSANPLHPNAAQISQIQLCPPQG